MALNVLVVDDSAVMRAIILKTLRLSGLPLGIVYEAGHGQEALQILDHHWVDLALVDINMPVMDGEELLRRVRQNAETATLPVIVVSTEGSDTRIAALRQDGAAFVHKPFTPEQLRNIIVDMTGVPYEQSLGANTVSNSGPDF